MRQPEFEAMLGPAKAYPQIWRILLGILVIVFCYLGATALVMMGAGAVVAAQQGLPGIIPFFADLQFADRPGTVLTLLLTFSGMALGPFLAAGALHYRGRGSLLGPWGEWWRGFVVAFLVVVVGLGAVLAVSVWFDPALPNMEPTRWATWLPLAIPLLFLQISAEELLFRGYLQQQLAARFAARWVWFGLPAFIFGMLHWDPELGRNLPLVLLSAFAFGLIAADLTERTGSLGAAMGLHFANNILALFVVSIQGTITGLALYVTPWPASQEGAVSLGLAISIIFLFVIWWIIKAILDR